MSTVTGSVDSTTAVTIASGAGDAAALMAAGAGVAAMDAISMLMMADPSQEAGVASCGPAKVPVLPT
jgi:hypothetical protein